MESEERVIADNLLEDFLTARANVLVIRDPEEKEKARKLRDYLRNKIINKMVTANNQDAIINYSTCGV